MQKEYTTPKTHDWIVRHLELAPGRTLVQQLCRNCGRAFAVDLTTGRQDAIRVSAFEINRLGLEVTSRWLSENCPAYPLMPGQIERASLTKFTTRGSERSS